jgi:mono/diheme cytochrome c family protein
MKKLFLILLSVVISLPFIYSFTLAEVQKNVATPTTKDNVTISGEQLFQNNCSACHGIDMTGNPPVFPSLSKVNERMQKNEVMELLQTGRKIMPSFAHLTEAERMAIAGYLYGETTETEMVTDITPAENGNRLFVANCARCHKVTPDDPQPPDQKEWGMRPAILGGITARYSIADFKNILNAGPCYMPSFDNLSDTDKEGIYAWLGAMEDVYYTSSTTGGYGCRMRCR